MRFTRVAVNTYDRTRLDEARALGFGLEIDAYILPAPQEELARIKAELTEIAQGFDPLSFHGTIVDRELANIHAYSTQALLEAYNASYRLARFHGAHNIVFHGNHWAQKGRENEWVASQADFWKRFLADKPPETRVYIENYIDDTPYLLRDLHDALQDARLGICLDTGHACCNSPLPVTEWIDILGKRIRHVHLHNNDGRTDRHWPLGKGVLDMRKILASLYEKAAPRMIVLECDWVQSYEWLMQAGEIG